jgi:enterochelin esterase family protein
LTLPVHIKAALGLVFAMAGGAALTEPAQPPMRSPNIANCASTPGKDICRTSIRFNAVEADRRLGRVNLTYWLDGDVLNIAARVAGPQSQLTGAIQDGMTRLPGGGDILWGAAYRGADLDRAIIDLAIRGQPAGAPIFVYRGPHAPAAPPSNAVLKGTLEVIEAPSAALGKTCKVSVYLPPGAAPASGYPAIIARDGDTIEPYVAILDALIERGQIPPVALVAVWPSESTEVAAPGASPGARDDVRGLDADAYARYSMFVQRELLPLVQKRFRITASPAHRMLFGHGEGADWALETAVRAPQVAHHVAAFSVSGVSEPPFQPGKGLDLQLAAGAYEAPYLRATRYTLNLAAASGVPSKIDVIQAGHSPEAWQYEFAKAVTETFGHLHQNR